MKITIVSETYFPQINGVSRTLGRLVDCLVEQGDQVQLIIPRYPVPAESQAPQAGDIQRNCLPGFSFPLYREVKIVACRPARVKTLLKTFDPDIVHVATEGPLGWISRHCAVTMHYPLATSFHTNFPDYLAFYKMGWLKTVSWKYLRYFHQAAFVTFCPTTSVKNELQRRGFDKLAIWGRGVDCDRFNPALRNHQLRRRLGLRPHTTAALYVGRIADEKNLALLLDVAQILKAEDVKLILTGDGPARQRLSEKAGDNVIFTGYKYGHELAQIYASADLFVFPSVTDTFGNVILEGMASGLPAVGFDAPGPRDIIAPNQTGAVVSQRTPGAFAAVLQQLVDAPARRREMSTQAREYALSCRWERINSAVRNAYLLQLTQ